MDSKHVVAVGYDGWLRPLSEKHPRRGRFFIDARFGVCRRTERRLSDRIDGMFLLLACSPPFTLISSLCIRIPYLVSGWITLLTSELLNNQQHRLTHSTGERPPRVHVLSPVHLPARRMLDVGRWPSTRVRPRRQNVSEHLIPLFAL